MSSLHERIHYGSPKLGGPGCKVCAEYRRRAEWRHEQPDEDRLFKIIENGV